MDYVIIKCLLIAAVENTRFFKRKWHEEFIRPGSNCVHISLVFSATVYDNIGYELKVIGECQGQYGNLLNQNISQYGI